MNTVENYLEFNMADDSVLICENGITYVIALNYRLGSWQSHTPTISKVVECYDENENGLSLDLTEEKLQELQVLINKNYSHETAI